MNSRRFVLTFIGLALLPLLLFHFQNCAPISAPTDSSGFSTVRLVDDYSKTQIQFVSSDNEIQDEATTADIFGLCNSAHNGAHLKWAVWADPNNSLPLETGTSSCVSGQFAVDLQQLDQFACGVSHLVVVQADWGDSTYARFSRHCQPLASQPINPPLGSPGGTTCSLEYSPASAAENPCLEVCYRDSQVVFSQPQDANQCSGLAAGLAGP